jgi:hypothetical protein
MPFNGLITGVSVNTMSWFNNNSKLDFIISNGSTGALTSIGVGLPDFTTLTFPIAGYSQTINNPIFNAGDGIACVIKLSSGSWILPFDPMSGIVSITIYVKFTS